MSKLNGWFRIWVVLTVAWSALAIGLGGLILSEIESPERRREWKVGFDCETYVDGTRVELLKSYSEREIIDASREKKVANKPDLQLTVDQCSNAITADYQAQRRAEINKIIMGTVASWIIPPLVLLLIGYAVAWIIRGFRRTPS